MKHLRCLFTLFFTVSPAAHAFCPPPPAAVGRKGLGGNYASSPFTVNVKHHERLVPIITTPTEQQQSTTSSTSLSATGVPKAMTRVEAFQVLGATVAAGALAAARAAPACAEARSTQELVRLIGDARRQLDPVDQLISDAKWDRIRNIIKTFPLADIKNLIAELARQSDEDESALLLGLRQDVLDHVQFLDSFSYNNVFVGEERQILGTKIDFATPRLELRQSREALDIIMDVLPSTN